MLRRLIPSALKSVAIRAQARAWLPGVGIGWPARLEKVAAAHALHPAADRHEQRQPADAVAHRLDRVLPGLARTVSTAAGQSRIAMSSTVNCVKLDGRSGLAR